MPSRIIKESITTSESLSEVSAEAERLFWRLVVKADDFGLYYGNPRILASMCFPLDPPKEQRIRAWLDELVAAGMVGTYTSDEDGKKYLKLLSWDRHQQQRAKKSKFPLPVAFDNTGFSGVEGANIQFGDTVVVIGIGPVGLMSVAGAAIRGAGRLIAVGHRELTKELAKKYGATDVVDYKDGDIVAQIMELTNNEKVDRVIIAGGTESTINDAYRMVKCGGNISNVAGYDFSKEFHLTVADAGCLVNHVTLTGRLCAGGRYRLENLMALIKNGRLDPTLLITHELHGFDKIEDGFRMMDERKTPDTIKPIVII